MARYKVEINPNKRQVEFHPRDTATEPETLPTEAIEELTPQDEWQSLPIKEREQIKRLVNLENELADLEAVLNKFSRLINAKYRALRKEVKALQKELDPAHIELYKQVHPETPLPSDEEAEKYYEKEVSRTGYQKTTSPTRPYQPANITMPSYITPHRSEESKLSSIKKPSELPSRKQEVLTSRDRLVELTSQILDLNSKLDLLDIPQDIGIGQLSYRLASIDAKITSELNKGVAYDREELLLKLRALLKEFREEEITMRSHYHGQRGFTSSQEKSSGREAMRTLQRSREQSAQRREKSGQKTQAA